VEVEISCTMKIGFSKIPFRKEKRIMEYNHDLCTNAATDIMVRLAETSVCFDRIYIIV
jgi:hypothetical protein